LKINFKTYLRWKIDLDDKRKGPISVPKNKLTEKEKDEMIKVATSECYMDYSPHIIVAKLADKGIYIASESSFYKALGERKLLFHRGKSKAPSKERPAPLVATGANQIWSWDITYMKSNVRGQFYYLYLFMDIFSRKIVGYDVHEEESMKNSSCLFEKIAINENINKDQLVLHADNGGPMKGATMLATLDILLPLKFSSADCSKIIG
jgi:transposase InsO family protein